MKIGMALTRLAAGSIVSRRSWENSRQHPKQLTMATSVREHVIELPCVYVQLGPCLLPWYMLREDMQADDWYVVWEPAQSKVVGQ